MKLLMLFVRRNNAARSGVLALAISLSGCGGSPTTPASSGYSGQWSGTTGQGVPIAFTISADENVTTISVSHNFNGCSGSQTFPDLNLPIAPQVQCIPGPCSPSITSYRQLGFVSGDRMNGPSIAIAGLFVSTSRAEGTVAFRNYAGCGDAAGVVSAASKR